MFWPAAPGVTGAVAHVVRSHIHTRQRAAGREIVFVTFSLCGPSSLCSCNFFFLAEFRARLSVSRGERWVYVSSTFQQLHPSLFFFFSPLVFFTVAVPLKCRTMLYNRLTGLVFRCTLLVAVAKGCAMVCSVYICVFAAFLWPPASLRCDFLTCSQLCDRKRQLRQNKQTIAYIF